MKMQKVKQNKDVTVWAPRDPTDTFMGCLSFFLYGHTGKRRFLRRKLMRFFARECFENAHALETVQLGPQPRFRKKRAERYHMQTADEAARFFHVNSARGRVSNARTMCRVVSRCFRVAVYLDQQRIGDKKASVIAHLHLQFCRQDKKFTLVYWSEKFQKVLTMTTYELRVSRVIGEMVQQGKLTRENDVHRITVQLPPHSKPVIYTVFPVGEYKQCRSIFIFRRCSAYSRKCVFVASCLVDEKDYNPYFFLGNDGDAELAVQLIVVETDTYKDAVNILQIQCKLSAKSYISLEDE